MSKLIVCNAMSLNGYYEGYHGPHHQESYR